VREQHRATRSTAGQIFAESPQNYVLPDVTVEKIDGEYQIILNGEQIPHLRISNTYKDIMSQDGNGSEVKDYIRDKIRSGKFLIKSIHQRQQTISNIAHEIVKRQLEFLDHGSAHLKPMTMVQIADIVGVHETTVSRAISGKYMSTPQGVFEMKYFFTPGYQTSSGEAMSNTSVKEAIEDLVKSENGSAPLSDKEIVEILSERGIPIARRTVAKVPHRAEHPAEQHAAEVLAAASLRFFSRRSTRGGIRFRDERCYPREGNRRMARVAGEEDAPRFLACSGRPPAEVDEGARAERAPA
jgi:RNA polymerase sigma-54 factor